MSMNEQSTEFNLSNVVKGLRLRKDLKRRLSDELRLYTAWLLYNNAEITCSMAAEMVDLDFRTFLSLCGKYRDNSAKSMNQIVEETEKLWDS